MKATPTKQVEEPKVSIQTAPNLEEDIEEILIVSTVTSTQDTPVATETQLNVKSTTDSEDGALESKERKQQQFMKKTMLLLRVLTPLLVN